MNWAGNGRPQTLNIALNLLQNKSMVTFNRNTKATIDKPQPGVRNDLFLDPLPVPEVSETNTDTAWGLFEDLQRIHEDDTTSAVTAKPDFAETQAGLPYTMDKKT